MYAMKNVLLFEVKLTDYLLHTHRKVAYMKSYRLGNISM